MSTKETFKPQRIYKDRLFRMLFSEKEKLLELYNALNGTVYTSPDDLEVTTWENVLYMGMKNDVSMMIDQCLNLYEHQSTWNPNMPLRGLFYLAQLYKELVKGKHLYSTRQVKIPTPVYVVFYNGRKDIGEEVDQKLSDAFLHGNKQSGMELKARVLNINYGHNRELMERCNTLREYSIFVGKVKENVKMMELLQAINLAVDECIEEDVLKEFLIERRADVVNALLTEYDEERVLADLSREFFEDGEEKGREEGLKEGLKEGVKEGQNRINKLIQCLVRDGRMDDVIRGTADLEYQKALLQEYQL